MLIPLMVTAQNVTIKAVNQPAATVFRSLIEQTGKNFVYSSDLLQGMKITVDAKSKPLKNVLNDIFQDTDIEYKIKGKNVVLKRKPKKKIKTKLKLVSKLKLNVKAPDIEPTMLDEIVVTSRLESPAVSTAEIGAKKVTGDEVRNTPVIFGEADVIKALHTLPGVTESTEGMAGMNVHGGNADENLYMLDNVPLYQVNHFSGLFSAFNTDIIRYADFFKSSVPAKYDGRLSSFMDVRLKNGGRNGHHGSARLGLTSGAFNISGPIGKKTTYLVGLRRSWYDVLTVPIFAVVNKSQDEKVRFHYYFMDLNAKLTHHFSDKVNGFVSVYFGDDMLKTGAKDDFDKDITPGGSMEDDKHNFHWGNLVAQTGVNYRINPSLSAEFTGAYTRFFSELSYHDIWKTQEIDGIYTEIERAKTSNNINDWIVRGDFDWQPNDNSRIRFGGNYIRHSFLPGTTTRVTETDTERMEMRDSTWRYGANEVNAYIEDDWTVTDKFRVNAGLHASVFYIDGKTKYGLSPRLSFSYRPTENVALKAAYTRTTQYVHQLTLSYLALPTDQWIPITGSFKPQTGDKIAVGGYWQSTNGDLAISVEGYYRWMHNLIDYRDEFYLHPPMEMWNARIVSGNGTAKGIDLMIEKQNGKITGHVAYSLAWTDRTFPEKNEGKTFPARFDNRHTVNVLMNWNISEKVQLSASWTGHSGNRFTLLPQMWETPDFGKHQSYYTDEVPLRAPVNNYQLPFYHRLDLACTVRNSRGYWTFNLYNAYNHMNTIAIRRGHTDSAWINSNTGYHWDSHPVFQKVKLLPIIPSISYTWLF